MTRGNKLLGLNLRKALPRKMWNRKKNHFTHAARKTNPLACALRSAYQTHYRQNFHCGDAGNLLEFYQAHSRTDADRIEGKSRTLFNLVFKIEQYSPIPNISKNTTNIKGISPTNVKMLGRMDCAESVRSKK